MMRKLYIFLGLLIPVLALAGPKPPSVVALGVEVQPTNVSCAGGGDGSFRITLLASSGFIVYEWSSIAPGALSGVGTLNMSSPSDFLDSLPPGDYLFRVINLGGADTTFGASIIEPPPMGGYMHVLSGFSGYAVACMDGPGTGRVRAEISGGTKDYSYFWSTGATGALAVNLPAGQHQVSISDGNGCFLEMMVTLEAPPPLAIEVNTYGETCLGQHSGRVDLAFIDGGIVPYSMSLGDETSSGYSATWDSLAAGLYKVVVKDKHGCSVEQAVEVATGPAFAFTAGPDMSLFSGDTLRLKTESDRLLTKVFWTPASGIAQDTLSGETLFFPFTSTEYRVLVQDSDGCLSMDTILITVHRNRALYFPNVFAPEGNSIENQFFSIYGDTGVRLVKSLRIFDRFGQLWFDKSNFPVNVPEAGWQGDAAGEKAAPGVYFWQAVVLFTDERQEIFQGDITLIR